jgi:hypothetical protein
MMPLAMKQPPPNFPNLVREPGRVFLRKIPHPTSEEWKKGDFWVKVLPYMRSQYDSLCSYCAQWIPHSTGNHTVDHFIPKSLRPALAYEWSNYRYVSSRFNSRKGMRSILDPFTLTEPPFEMDFSSFLLTTNPNLQPGEQALALETIRILKLNSDDDLVYERQEWTNEYRAGEITFEHLRRKAPFLAYEVDRQGLRT